MTVSIARDFVGALFFRDVPVDVQLIRATTDTAYPLIYSVTPALPAGLIMNPQTGRITGTPTASGSMANYTITVEEFLGTQFVFNDVVAANMSNYNLRARAIAAGWNGTQPLKGTVTINAGVVISSTTPLTPAWTTGSIPNGSSLTLNVNGVIRGADAVAGTSSTGGVALQATYPVTVNMTTIATVTQIHTGVAPYNGYIFGGSGLNPPTFVTAFAQDGTSQAGAAISGGALITWVTGAALNNVYGPVDNWGTYPGPGGSFLQYLINGSKAAQATPTGNDWAPALPADWYWEINAASSTPLPAKKLRFTMAYINTSGSNMQVYYYGGVDDRISSAWLNGMSITVGDPFYHQTAHSSAPITMVPGLNVLTIIAENLTTPNQTVAGASLELRASSDNRVLAWRNSWKLSQVT